jgi:hypothetical protein
MFAESEGNMSDFESILTAAKDLSEVDRKRLIDELYETLPANAWTDFESELDRDITEVEAGDTKGTPWSQVRDEMLDSIKNDQSR